MVVIGLVAVAVALGGQILLIASVARRLRRGGESLAATLGAHAVVPRWARSAAVGYAVEAVQAVLGMAGLALVASGRAYGPAFNGISAATAFLFAGFATYLTVVARRRGRVRCSCLGARERVGAAAVVRAGLFAVAAAAAAVLGVPADSLTWQVRAAVAGGAILVAGFAVFLVGLTQIARETWDVMVEAGMREGRGGR